MMGIILIFLQVGLLWALWHASVHGTDLLVYRLANPFCWLIGFYALWFLVPQIFFMAFDGHIIGMERYSTSDLNHIYRETQVYLVIFLSLLTATAFAFYTKAGRSTGKDSASSMLRLSNDLSYDFWLYSFLAIGTAGNIYVATQNVALFDGFRSEIIRSTSGKIATTLSYFAAFSFTYLLVRSWPARRYALILFITVSFATSVILTGARGRLLWPLFIIAILLACKKEKINIVRVGLYAFFGLLLLLALDPFVKIFKFGSDSYVWSLEEFFSPLLHKRNFDGFANFAMIVTHDRILSSPEYLFTGARDVFMETYHPRIYSLGIGFGATLPGMLWISGGIYGLVAGTVLFGIILGLINLWLRRNRSNLFFWSYLFAMPWLCAIGGNLLESMDKMLAAMAGPVILYLAHGGDIPRRTRVRSPSDRRRVGNIVTSTSPHGRRR